MVVRKLEEQGGSLVRTQRYVVRLSEEEQARLRTLVACGETTASEQLHARILLKANQGEGGSGWIDAAIAGALDVDPSTVFRVRQRYASDGLEAALSRKAPNRMYERKLDGPQEARLVALACSGPPEGRQRWTLRLLADELVRLEVVDTISYETVRTTLKQTT